MLIRILNKIVILIASRSMIVVLIATAQNLTSQIKNFISIFIQTIGSFVKIANFVVVKNNMSVGNDK